jgi:hypothetical protein
MLITRHMLSLWPSLLWLYIRIGNHLQCESIDEVAVAPPLLMVTHLQSLETCKMCVYHIRSKFGNAGLIKQYMTCTKKELHYMHTCAEFSRRLKQELCAAEAIFCCPTENSRHLEA